MIRRFCPGLIVPSITDLTPAFFEARGLRAALLDVDNTLVLWHGTEVDPAISDWVLQLKAAGMRFCLASNTRRGRRLAALGDALGIPYELGVAKPRLAGLRRCLARVDSPAEATAMIGDQLFTDIWGGNRCGLYTILVQPMSTHEFIGTRVVSRPLEKVVMAALRRQGLVGNDVPSPVPGTPCGHPQCRCMDGRPDPVTGTRKLP
jgi:HAD superfamily phosphatase (TIGR01668 family)